MHNPMMLNNWMKATGTSPADLAKKLRVTRSQIYNLLHGHSQPSIETAVALEEVTDGEVPVAGWVKRKKRSRAA